MNMYLSSLKDEMGMSSMYFSSFNPNGRYKLDLSKKVERDTAKNLIAINKRVYTKIVAKERIDRS